MTILAANQHFAGRYRIERPLARGGMGAVYVATHLETEAQVALKVLLPHRLESQDARERFRTEARVAAQLQSEHIVRIYDAGLDEATDMPFLAMELLHGRSLADEVEARGRCSRPETLDVLRQVAAGLDRAHGNRDARGELKPVIHRDLKPDNLFVTQRDDGSSLIKILDFGLAKVLQEQTSFSTDIKGTPEFMSFEQLRGEPVSPRTDVWPLGLIAFYLLSGRSYWRTVSNPHSDVQALYAELLQPQKLGPSERAKQLGVEPSWPASFDGWFLRCVAADPAERFATAGQAVGALEVALRCTPRPLSSTLDASLRAARHDSHAATSPTHRLDTQSLPASQRPPVSGGEAPGTAHVPTWGSPFESVRGGDDQRGFEVTALAEQPVLRLRCWGFWNAAVAAAYDVAVRAGIAHFAGAGPWYVMAHIAQYPPQQTAVAALHGALMRQARSRGMRRACSVVSSALTQMQIRRLAEEHGMPEVAFFTQEKDAIAWVTRAVSHG